MANTTKRAAMSVDIFGTTLTITFSNGNDLAIDVSTLTPEIQRAAMLHGIKQKLVDAAAIARNTDNGLSASIDNKYKAVADVHARLTGPNATWNKERAPVGTATNAKNILVRALMHMTGKDKAYVDDFLSAKTKEQREALKRNPKVLAAIAELQAANASDGTDTDELLDELGVDVSESTSEEHVPAPTIAQGVQEAIQKPKRTRKVAA